MLILKIQYLTSSNIPCNDWECSLSYPEGSLGHHHNSSLPKGVFLHLALRYSTISNSQLPMCSCTVTCVVFSVYIMLNGIMCTQLCMMQEGLFVERTCFACSICVCCRCQEKRTWSSSRVLGHYLVNQKCVFCMAIVEATVIPEMISGWCINLCVWGC